MKIVTLFFTLFISSVTAQAATISFETRGINQGVDSSNLMGSWSNQTSSISNDSISEFTRYRSGKNSFSHLMVNFNVNQPLTFGFQLGLDAHYGAEAYLDGNLIGNRTDDLWWSYNWSNNDVMSLLGNSLLSGGHILELYWAESCCNGSNSIRFTTDNTNWKALSVANLNATNIPEPMTIFLLLLGVFGLAATRPQKNILIEPS